SVILSKSKKAGITSIYILNTNIPFINGRHPEPCSIEVPFHVRVIAIESIPTFLFLLWGRRSINYQQVFKAAGITIHKNPSLGNRAHVYNNYICTKHFLVLSIFVEILIDFIRRNTNYRDQPASIPWFWLRIWTRIFFLKRF